MALNHVYIFRSPTSLHPDQERANNAMGSFSYEAAVNIALRCVPNPNPDYFNSDFIKKHPDHLIWKLMILVAEKSHIKKHADFINVIFSEKHNIVQIKKIVEEYI